MLPWHDKLVLREQDRGDTSVGWPVLVIVHEQGEWGGGGGRGHKAGRAAQWQVGGQPAAAVQGPLLPALVHVLPLHAGLGHGDAGSPVLSPGTWRHTQTHGRLGVRPPGYPRHEVWSKDSGNKKCILSRSYLLRLFLKFPKSGRDGDRLAWTLLSGTRSKVVPGVKY